MANTLSVIIPARNEAGNLPTLLDEINAALTAIKSLKKFEVVVVNDGSTDHTDHVLKDYAANAPWLVIAGHKHAAGQSAAIDTAVRRHAQYDYIGVLDGDGQNDPADFAALWDWVLGQDGAAMAIGRRAKRQDSEWRKNISGFAGSMRRFILKDNIPDSGCGLKILPKALYLELPYFDHMHRFMPTLVQRAGGAVASLPVSHRPRNTGLSNYGTLDRALVGITDIFGVWWLKKRMKPRTHV